MDIFTVNIHISVSISLYGYVCLYIYICIDNRIYIYIYAIYIYIYIYIHTYIHHRQVCMPASVQVRGALSGLLDRMMGLKVRPHLVSARSDFGVDDLRVSVLNPEP